MATTNEAMELTQDARKRADSQPITGSQSRRVIATYPDYSWSQRASICSRTRASRSITLRSRQGRAPWSRSPRDVRRLATLIGAATALYRRCSRCCSVSSTTQFRRSPAVQRGQRYLLPLAGCTTSSHSAGAAISSRRPASSRIATRSTPTKASPTRRSACSRPCLDGPESPQRKRELGATSPSSRARSTASLRLCTSSLE